MITGTRRDFLLTTLATVGAATLPLAVTRRGEAAASLVGVEWGGGFVDALKKTAERTQTDVQWELHQGGAAAILAKIKATWPNPQYDFVAAWDPVFSAMIREDWLETVTLADVPNLADIPETLIFKDSQGNWKNIPRAVAGNYYGYRSDTSPIEIKSIDDLFDSRLKGQICWPHPLQSTCMQIVTLALKDGGNEFNMEPGWKLMKELAKTGNIARIAEADTDFITSLTTGETSVSFVNMGAWVNIAKAVPVVHLTKQPGMKVGLFSSGFVVLKNRPNTAAAFKFINECINAENNALYSELAGEAVANVKAKSPPELSHMAFTKEELAEFTYTPDWAYMSTQLDPWLKRWEEEISPLL